MYGLTLKSSTFCRGSIITIGTFMNSIWSKIIATAYHNLIFLTKDEGNNPVFLDFKWMPLHQPSSLCLTIMTTSPLCRSNSYSLLAGNVSITSYLFPSGGAVSSEVFVLVFSPDAVDGWLASVFGANSESKSIRSDLFAVGTFAGATFVCPTLA